VCGEDNRENCVEREREEEESAQLTFPISRPPTKRTSSSSSSSPRTKLTLPSQTTDEPEPNNREKEAIQSDSPSSMEWKAEGVTGDKEGDSLPSCLTFFAVLSRPAWGAEARSLRASSVSVAIWHLAFLRPHVALAAFPILVAVAAAAGVGAVAAAKYRAHACNGRRSGRVKSRHSRRSRAGMGAPNESFSLEKCHLSFISCPLLNGQSFRRSPPFPLTRNNASSSKAWEGGGVPKRGECSVREGENVTA